MSIGDMTSYWCPHARTEKIELVQEVYILFYRRGGFCDVFHTLEAAEKCIKELEKSGDKGMYINLYEPRS